MTHDAAHNTQDEKFYPFDTIEPKWQKFWRENRLFNVDTKDSKDKYYCLMMFPYPSAALCRPRKELYNRRRRGAL